MTTAKCQYNVPLSSSFGVAVSPHRCNFVTKNLLVSDGYVVYVAELIPATKRLADYGVIAFSDERADSGSHQLTDNGVSF